MIECALFCKPISLKVISIKFITYIVSRLLLNSFRCLILKTLKGITWLGMTGKPFNHSMIYSRCVLQKNLYFLIMNINSTRQIPHAFQQQLSAKKTPTLCEATRSFSAITKVWKEFQDQHPETFDIVQAGINKLEDYSNQTSLTPAYTVAMCTFSPIWISWIQVNFSWTIIVLNSTIKLAWHCQNSSFMSQATLYLIGMCCTSELISLFL